jgi:hypothetical protein
MHSRWKSSLIPATEASIFWTALGGESLAEHPVRTTANNNATAFPTIRITPNIDAAV